MGLLCSTFFHFGAQSGPKVPKKPAQGAQSAQKGGKMEPQDYFVLKYVEVLLRSDVSLVSVESLVIF